MKINNEAENEPRKKNNKSVIVSNAIFLHFGLNVLFVTFNKGPKKLYNSKTSQNNEINMAVIIAGFSKSV